MSFFLFSLSCARALSLSLLLFCPHDDAPARCFFISLKPLACWKKNHKLKQSGTCQQKESLNISIVADDTQP